MALTGRPCEFTQEMADKICEFVATNTCGYQKLAHRYPDLPELSTVTAWRVRFPSFSSQYLEAKRFQALLLAEETLDLCDELSPYEDEKGVSRIDAGILGKTKLQVATRQWHASKLAPKIYGDKQIIEQTTSENESLKAELAELRAKLAEQSKAEY